MNLKQRLRTFLNTRIVKPGVKAGLLSEIPTVQHIAAIFPHEDANPSYTLPRLPRRVAQTP